MGTHADKHVETLKSCVNRAAMFMHERITVDIAQHFTMHKKPERKLVATKDFKPNELIFVCVGSLIPLKDVRPATLTGNGVNRYQKVFSNGVTNYYMKAYSKSASSKCVDVLYRCDRSTSRQSCILKITICFLLLRARRALIF